MRITFFQLPFTQTQRDRIVDTSVLAKYSIQTLPTKFETNPDGTRAFTLTPTGLFTATLTVFKDAYPTHFETVFKANFIQILYPTLQNRFQTQTVYFGITAVDELLPEQENKYNFKCEIDVVTTYGQQFLSELEDKTVLLKASHQNVLEKKHNKLQSILFNELNEEKLYHLLNQNDFNFANYTFSETKQIKSPFAYLQTLNLFQNLLQSSTQFKQTIVDTTQPGTAQKVITLASNSQYWVNKGKHFFEELHPRKKPGGTDSSWIKTKPNSYLSCGLDHLFYLGFEEKWLYLALFYTYYFLLVNHQNKEGYFPYQTIKLVESANPPQRQFLGNAVNLNQRKKLMLTTPMFLQNKTFVEDFKTLNQIKNGLPNSTNAQLYLNRQFYKNDLFLGGNKVIKTLDKQNPRPIILSFEKKGDLLEIQGFEYQFLAKTDYYQKIPTLYGDGATTHKGTNNLDLVRIKKVQISYQLTLQRAQIDNSTIHIFEQPPIKLFGVGMDISRLRLRDTGGGGKPLYHPGEGIFFDSGATRKGSPSQLFTTYARFFTDPGEGLIPHYRPTGLIGQPQMRKGDLTSDGIPLIQTTYQQKDYYTLTTDLALEVVSFTTNNGTTTTLFSFKDAQHSLQTLNFAIEAYVKKIQNLNQDLVVDNTEKYLGTYYAQHPDFGFSFDEQGNAHAKRMFALIHTQKGYEGKYSTFSGTVANKKQNILEALLYSSAYDGEKPIAFQTLKDNLTDKVYLITQNQKQFYQAIEGLLTGFNEQALYQQGKGQTLDQIHSNKLLNLLYCPALINSYQFTLKLKHGNSLPLLPYDILNKKLSLSHQNTNTDQIGYCENIYKNNQQIIAANLPVPQIQSDLSLLNTFYYKERIVAEQKLTLAEKQLQTRREQEQLSEKYRKQDLIKNTVFGGLSALTGAGSVGYGGYQAYQQGKGLSSLPVVGGLGALGGGASLIADAVLGFERLNEQRKMTARMHELNLQGRALERQTFQNQINRQANAIGLEVGFETDTESKLQDTFPNDQLYLQSGEIAPMDRKAITEFYHFNGGEINRFVVFKKTKYLNRQVFNYLELGNIQGVFNLPHQFLTLLKTEFEGGVRIGNESMDLQKSNGQKGLES